jgi:hypothetical protein
MQCFSALHVTSSCSRKFKEKNAKVLVHKRIHDIFIEKI